MPSNVSQIMFVKKFVQENINISMKNYNATT